MTADSAELTFTGRVALITGARTFLAGELIRQLEADPRYRRILAADLRLPEQPLERAEYVPIDLTAPTAEEELADIAGGAGVDTVVHAAFLSNPTHAAGWAHELEDIGTMHVLGACASLRPSRLVMTSTTLVYGANPDNPNSISEDRGLEARGKPPFLAEKIRAERQLAEFATAHPSTATAALRFAPVLGSRVRNFITELLARPIVPKLAGYDPLVQAVHENDASRALKLAVDCSARGPFNIVGRGVIRYTTLLALLGRLPVPLPRALWRPLARAMWAAQLSPAPPELLDFLRFLCVADGARAAAELGFRPRYHVRDAATELFGELDSDDTLFARALG
jgi:UDP-glucose 4-epimerase